MTQYAAANQEDVRDIEAWAEVVTDALKHAPPDARAAILSLAIKNDEAARAKAEDHDGGLVFIDYESWLADMAPRNYRAIRLKALLVQVFVRGIKNNHSPQDAAAILFAQQRFGHGSGRLLDYLNGMPKPKEYAR